MTPAPRRPRRWSWACAGTLVRVGMAFALAATVAMPARDLKVRAVDEEFGVVVVAGPAGARAVVLSDARFDAAHWHQRDPWSPFALATLHRQGRSLTCRETGPRVALEGLWEWLTE